MIKLIVFDLWKTLVYSDIPHRKTVKIQEETGSKIPNKRFIKIFEDSIQTKVWDSREDVYRNLCKNSDIEPSEKNVKKISEIMKDSEEKIKPYPHSIQMLKALKKRGYKIGLLTNSSCFDIESLKKKTNLLDYIDYPVFSFDLGMIKPDVRMFQEVLKKADCKPEEAIMIGDKMDDDFFSAKSIGMNAVLFRSYEQLKKDLARFSIDI